MKAINTTKYVVINTEDRNFKDDYIKFNNLSEKAVVFIPDDVVTKKEIKTS